MILNTDVSSNVGTCRPQRGGTKSSFYGGEQVVVEEEDITVLQESEISKGTIQSGEICAYIMVGNCL